MLKRLRQLSYIDEIEDSSSPDEIKKMKKQRIMVDLVDIEPVRNEVVRQKPKKGIFTDDIRSFYQTMENKDVINSTAQSDERPEYHFAAFDPAEVHFAACIIGYTPPDKPVKVKKVKVKVETTTTTDNKKKRKRKESIAPVEEPPAKRICRPEKVRIISAFQMDLQREDTKMVTMSYNYDERPSVLRKAAKAKVDRTKAQLAEYKKIKMFGKAGAQIAKWNPLFDLRPLPYVATEPMRDARPGAETTYKGPHFHSFTKVIHATVHTMDEIRGIPHEDRVQGHRMKKAGVDHRTPSYEVRKQQSIDHLRLSLAKNKDRGGESVVNALQANGWKLDDLGDAYNTALAWARDTYPWAPET
jgi:hypothetical protein